MMGATCAMYGSVKSSEMINGDDTTHQAPKWARFHGRSSTGGAGGGGGGDGGFGFNDDDDDNFVDDDDDDGAAVDRGGSGNGAPFIKLPTSNISGYAQLPGRLRGLVLDWYCTTSCRFMNQPIV